HPACTLEFSSETHTAQARTLGARLNSLYLRIHIPCTSDRVPTLCLAGVEQVKMDPGKNQVTVTGTMDAKALPEKLRKKLRRPVDVVPPGKGDNKEKDKDGCNKDGKQQQQQQQGGDGKQCKEAAEKALAAELQLWKTAFYDQQAMQATEFLLSDENPNACAVM
uniref:HMA domain-containing protein n=1 Tax=Aegilops tauschii subsp. strangulata TaxID=200361 RepID=A0A453Q377_AEGTS